MKKTARFLGVAGLAAIGLAGVATAQLAEFDIRSSYPLEAPEALKVFEGSAKCLPGRGGPGIDPNAARVEIRAVKFKLGELPMRVDLTPDGKSDEERNPLVLETRIGVGVVGERPGRFSVCVPREELAKVEVVEGGYAGFFARVYDAPTVAQSTYYIDSEVVTNNPAQLYTNLVFAQTSMKSISGDSNLDQDHDGLTDQEEAIMGTDYKNPDTDGDGVDDFWETAFGLDPLNPPMISAMTTDRTEASVNAILPDESAWHVEWPASTNPGVRYTLEFVQDVGDWSKEVPEGEEGPVHEYAITNAITQTNWAQDVTPWMSTWTRGFLRLRQELDRSVFSDPETQEPDGGE